VYGLMVMADPVWVVALEELGLIAPALTFNPFTMFQTAVFMGLTAAAVGLGG